MLQADELRTGNFVFWSPVFIHSNITEKVQVEIAAILPGKAGYISSHLEHRAEPFEDDVITKEIPYALYEEFEPIPLTKEWLKKLQEKIKYPEWIQYVHELQNWYYWNHNKKELVLND